MLLTILTLTQVTAEWVQISQQHYRKPLRSYHPLTDRLDVEDATTPWSYNNRSTTEYNWNNTPTRSINNGYTKRIRDYEATETITEDSYRNIDEEDIRTSNSASEASIEFKNNLKQKGTIEKVSNKGNIQRVQLNNTPVKSPIGHKTDEEKAKTRYEELPLDNEEQNTQSNKNAETKLNNRRIYVNNIRNKYATEATMPTELESSEDIYIPKQKFKDHTVINNILPKPTFITETENFIHHKHDYSVHDNTQTMLGTTDIDQELTTNTFDEDITESMPARGTTKKSDSLNAENKVNNIMKEEPIHKHLKTNPYRDEVIRKDQKHKDKAKPQVAPKLNNNRNKIKENNEEKGKTSKEKPGIKVNNLENLLKIVKVVSETISRNTRRNFSGKLNYLHELKDSIMANIAHRIDTAWPDDDVASHRRSRSAHISPRGHHVQFPSSESALMTISFLTFAVFLIKLVLQVIQTYKNKTMMVAPVMVAAAGRSSFRRSQP